MGSEVGVDASEGDRWKDSGNRRKKKKWQLERMSGVRGNNVFSTWIIARAWEFEQTLGKGKKQQSGRDNSLLEGSWLSWSLHFMRSGTIEKNGVRFGSQDRLLGEGELWGETEWWEGTHPVKPREKSVPGRENCHCKVPKWEWAKDVRGWGRQGRGAGGAGRGQCSWSIEVERCEVRPEEQVGPGHIQPLRLWGEVSMWRVPLMCIYDLCSTPAWDLLEDLIHLSSLAESNRLCLP